MRISNDKQYGILRGRAGQKDLILRDLDGLESDGWWIRNDDYAGYTARFGKYGYEFVSSRIGDVRVETDSAPRMARS